LFVLGLDARELVAVDAGELPADDGRVCCDERGEEVVVDGAVEVLS